MFERGQKPIIRLTHEEAQAYYTEMETQRAKLIPSQTSTVETLYTKLEDYEQSPPRDPKIIRLSSRKNIAKGNIGRLSFRLFNVALTKAKITHISTPLKECLDIFANLNAFFLIGIKEIHVNKTFIKAVIDLFVIIIMMENLSALSRKKNSNKDPGDLDRLLEDFRKELFLLKNNLCFATRNHRYISEHIKEAITSVSTIFYQAFNIPEESARNFAHNVFEIVDEPCIGNSIDPENRNGELIQKEIALQLEVAFQVKDFQSAYAFCQPKEHEKYEANDHPIVRIFINE